MPDPQIEYVESLVSHFVNDGHPTSLLKSLVLNAMLACIDRDIHWEIQTSAHFPLKREVAFIVCWRPGQKPIPLSFDFFTRRFTHQQLFAQIQEFFQTQKQPLYPGLLGFIGTAIDLNTEVMEVVRQDFTRLAPHVLRDYCYDRQALELGLDLWRDPMNPAAECTANAWIAAVADFCSNPQVQVPPWSPRLYSHVVKKLAKRLESLMTLKLFWYLLIQELPVYCDGSVQKPLRRSLFETNREWFAQFLQNEFLNLVKRGFETVADHSVLQQETTYSALFECCLWVATPYAERNDDSNLFKILLQIVDILPNKKSLAPGYHPFIIFFDQFCLNMIIKPRMQNIDHFNAGLQLRGFVIVFLQMCYVKKDSVAGAIVFHLLCKHGLLPELYLGAYSTKMSAECPPPRSALMNRILGLDCLKNPEHREYLDKACGSLDYIIQTPTICRDVALECLQQKKGVIQQISSGRSWRQETQSGWTQTGCFGLAYDQMIVICTATNVEGYNLLQQALRLLPQGYENLGLRTKPACTFLQSVMNIVFLYNRVFWALPASERRDFYWHGVDPNKNVLAILWDFYHQGIAESHLSGELLNQFVEDYTDIVKAFFNPKPSAVNQHEKIEHFRFGLLGFLNDPRSKLQVERHLASTSSDLVVKTFMDAIQYHILDEHASTAVQDALPRFTLRLLIKELDAYVAAIGQRHHKAQINALLPFVVEAICDENLSALFLHILCLTLQGGHTNSLPSATGHLSSMLKRFGRHIDSFQRPHYHEISPRVSPQIIQAVVAEKKYYLYEVLWQGILGNTEREKLFISNFFAAIDADYADAKKIEKTSVYVQFDAASVETIDQMLAKIQREPEGLAANERSCIFVLATYTKLKPTHQQKLPLFSLAILMSELKKYVQANIVRRSDGEPPQVGKYIPVARDIIGIILGIFETPHCNHFNVVENFTSVLSGVLQQQIDSTLWSLLNLFPIAQKALELCGLQTFKEQRVLQPAASAPQAAEVPSAVAAVEVSERGEADDESYNGSSISSVPVTGCKTSECDESSGGGGGESEDSVAVPSAQTTQANDAACVEDSVSVGPLSLHDCYVADNIAVAISYYQSAAFAPDFQTFVQKHVVDELIQWSTMKVALAPQTSKWMPSPAHETVVEFFIALRSAGLLENMLRRGRLLHALIQDQFFNEDPQCLVALCEILYTVDWLMFGNFLQDEIGPLISLCHVQDVAAKLDGCDCSQNLLTKLFTVCLWVAKPYTNSRDEQGLLPNFRGWLLDRHSWLRNHRIADYPPLSRCDAKIIFSCFLQAMVIDPRKSARPVDNFHAGLQIRRLLCDFIFRVDVIDKLNSILALYDAALEQGLVPELWLGTEKTVDKQDLLLHRGFDVHRAETILLLLDKLNEKNPLASWVLDASSGEWNRCSRHPAILRMQVLAVVDSDKNTVLNAAIQEFVYQVSLESRLVANAIRVRITIYLDPAVDLIETLYQTFDRAYRTQAVDSKLQLLCAKNTTGTSPFELLWDQYQYLKIVCDADSFAQLFTLFSRIFTAVLNSAMCSLPKQHLHPKFVLDFLSDSKRAAMLDRQCCKNVDSIHHKLGDLIAPLIRDQAGDKEPLSSTLGLQRIDIQNKLPGVTLILLQLELQHYAQARGSKHHKEKINQLLPLMQQALDEQQVSPLFIYLVFFALQGGVNAHARPNPEGTLAGLMRRFQRQFEVLPEFTAATCLAIVSEKKPCFDAVLMLAVQGNPALEAEVRRLQYNLSRAETSASSSSVPNLEIQAMAPAATMTLPVAASDGQTVPTISIEFLDEEPTKWGLPILTDEFAVTDPAFSLFFSNRPRPCGKMVARVKIFDASEIIESVDSFIGDNRL